MAEKIVLQKNISKNKSVKAVIAGICVTNDERDKQIQFLHTKVAKIEESQKHMKTNSTSFTTTCGLPRNILEKLPKRRAVLTASVAEQPKPVRLDFPTSQSNRTTTIQPRYCHFFNQTISSLFARQTFHCHQ
jgi:hypothetical protein